jgi:hypothetical protein
MAERGPGMASHVSTAAFAANCNCGSDLVRRQSTRSGTVAWGTVLGTVWRDRRLFHSEP